MTEAVMPVLDTAAKARLKAAKEEKQVVFLATIPMAAGVCQNCQGLGYIAFRFVQRFYDGSPSIKKLHTGWDDERQKFYSYKSEAFPCPICTDNTNKISFLVQQAGIEMSQRSWRVDFLKDKPGKETALQVALDLLQCIPNVKGWAVFYGDFGTGKTGLLVSLTAQMALAGVSARYVRADDILSEIKDTYGDQSTNLDEADLIARYSSFSFLAIDEVDRITGTEWELKTLQMLLDRRYMRRHELCTTFATNCEPDLLPAGFEYLASRLKDGERVLVAGDELRGGRNE
jgi:DNA replication protein DnaC